MYISLFNYTFKDNLIYYTIVTKKSIRQKKKANVIKSIFYAH